MKGDLDGAGIRTLLNSHCIGRIGCVSHGQPYIFPVNYAFDGTNIICQSDDGIKLNILRRHKTVCFQVDAIVTLNLWQSVLALGLFEELSGRQATAARDLLYERIFPGYQHLLDNSTDEKTASPNTRMRVKKVMFRIDISEITGKYEAPEKKTNNEMADSTFKRL